MTDLMLTKIRFSDGVWHGIVTGAPAMPQLRVMHHDLPVEDVAIQQMPDTGTWALRVTIPARAIADGVQTFAVFDAQTDAALGHFTITGDEQPADDLRAEVALLRAELDMLKRAFRRHCLETA